ncbi:hypothetical protein [Bradyrhizobium sp. DASA03120]|uniref:hypothetical protein n=1 Tax=Bradyrhizobium sp. SMVTL-02 TaxID=3395917 RepID=UPI003F700528
MTFSRRLSAQKTSMRRDFALARRHKRGEVRLAGLAAFTFRLVLALLQFKPHFRDRLSNAGLLAWRGWRFSASRPHEPPTGIRCLTFFLSNKGLQQRNVENPGPKQLCSTGDIAGSGLIADGARLSPRISASSAICSAYFGSRVKLIAPSERGGYMGPMTNQRAQRELMGCYDCGGNISFSAVACPHCGSREPSGPYVQSPKSGARTGSKRETTRLCWA